MSQMSTAGAKSELRKNLIQRRNLNHISRDETVDVGITRNLIALCERLAVRTVACYLSFGTEPTTRDFLTWAQEQDLRVLLPIALPDGQMDWVYSTGNDTSTGIFGFAEASGLPAELGGAELILVPALAVDRRGQRLGKGKGYYDRSLSEISNAKVYAVIYEAEVLDEIPTEIHDVAVDGFVTESRISEIGI